MVIVAREEISLGWCYLLYALIATAIIKSMMSLVRAWQKDKAISRQTPAHWWDEIKHSDYIVAFGVGSIEILVYPILIYLGAWQPIIWWLGIKTAARWRWTPRTVKDVPDARQRYTNFVFGNALVIAAALLLTALVDK